MPNATTAQVATVRHKTSVPVNCQIASRQATTAMRMHALVVQKAILRTAEGLTNPRFGLCCSGKAKVPQSLLRRYRNDYEIGMNGSECGKGGNPQRQMPRIVTHPHTQLHFVALGIVGCQRQ